MRVERIRLGEWGDALPSSGAEVFHAPEALAVLAEYAPGDLHLYAGFRGDQRVGLFPLFVNGGMAGVRSVTSPPPSMGVPHLGPVLLPQSPKRRKRERLNRRFVEHVFDDLALDDARTLVRVVGSPAYADPRPFDWTGFAVEPAFTYHLDVDGRDPDALRRSFSKSLRREIAAAEATDVGVDRGGDTDLRAVYRQTADRYAEQDAPFRLEWEYVRDLVAALGDRARVYVARDPSGAVVGGIVVLYSADAAYFWLGGARATYDGVGVNGLLHWRILRDLAADPPVASATTYDLMGANTERLCRYKAKFGGDLVPYYVVESDGVLMTLAKYAYALV